MAVTDRFFCSVAAGDRDEAALGTASRIDHWLLVEAPGPWGPQALPRNRSMSDGLLRQLQLHAAARHTRTLLIRRPPGAPAGPPGGRRLFVADSRPGHERLVTRLVPDDAELSEIRLPIGEADSGWRPAEWLVAVCTHGGHDACCAVRGRPVAQALATSHPLQTWEVSHIGGDRFAANVLVLPGGHYLGQLPAGAATEAVHRLLAGQRPAPWYRGRSCWSRPVQAALELAAQQLDLVGLDDLRPVRIDAPAAHRWEVGLQRAPDGSVVTATVEQHRGPLRSRLTCRAEHDTPVPSWRLVALAVSP
jgi:hypothetical protein